MYAGPGKRRKRSCGLCAVRKAVDARRLYQLAHKKKNGLFSPAVFLQIRFHFSLPPVLFPADSWQNRSFSVSRPCSGMREGGNASSVSHWNPWRQCAKGQSESLYTDAKLLWHRHFGDRGPEEQSAEWDSRIPPASPALRIPAFSDRHASPYPPCHAPGRWSC